MIIDPVNGTPSVAYTRTRTAQTGKGSIVQEYDIPITHGTLNNNDWEATATRLAREGAPSATYADHGPLQWQYGYPFAPQNAYGYRQGALTRQSTYDEQGNLLSETANTYDYLPAIQTIQGLIKDKIPSQYTFYNQLTEQNETVDDESFIYSMYDIHLMTIPLLTGTTTTVFDPADFSGTMVSTSARQYAGSGYPYLVSTQQTDPEGIISRKYFTYNHDFTNTANGAENGVKALDRLGASDIKGLPVETYTTLQRQGEAEKLTGAAFREYDFTAGNKPIMAQQFAMRINEPEDIMNFSPTEIVNGGLKKDGRYEQLGTTVSTDKYANITATEDKNKNRSATLYGYGGRIPVLSIYGAYADQVAFSNFENPRDVVFGFEDYNFSFDEDAWQVSPLITGRVAGNALDLQSGEAHALQATIEKEMGQYLFSCWIQAGGNATVQVVVTDGNQQQVTADMPVTASTTWTYYEVALDMTGLASGTVAVKVTTDAAIAVDDLTLFPKDVTFAYTTLGPGLLTMAETNHLGRSVYYEYDEADRVRIVRDYAGNIIERKTYSNGPDDNGAIDPVITFEEALQVNVPARFTALHVRDVANSDFYWHYALASSNPDPATHDFGQAVAVHGSNEAMLTLPVLPIVQPNELRDRWVVMLKVTTGQETRYSTVLIDEDMIQEVVPVMLEACVAGPLSFDLCSGDTGPSYSCDTPQLLQNHITGFFVTASGGDLQQNETYSYQWYKSSTPYIHLGVSTVAIQGANTDTFYFDKQYLESFYLICKVSTNQNYEAQKVFHIEFYESTPNCPMN